MQVPKLNVDDQEAKGSQCDAYVLTSYLISFVPKS